MPGVFAAVLFQFRQTPAGVVRLFCRNCGKVVSARGFQRRDQAELVQVATVIRDAIAKGEPELDLIEMASHFFWAPTSGRSGLHHLAGPAATLWSASFGIDRHCAADETFTGMAGGDDCGDRGPALWDGLRNETTSVFRSHGLFAIRAQAHRPKSSRTFASAIDFPFETTP